MSIYYDRREFVKKAAISAAGVGLIGSYGFLQTKRISANDNIRVAVIGTNSRGASLARGFALTEGIDVSCICDVDDKAVTKGLNAVKKAAPQKKVTGMKDFRHALDDNSLDAVVIAMPDHWHASAAIMALQAGKHVYIEKPGSHNPHEGELVAEAVRTGKKPVSDFYDSNKSVLLCHLGNIAHRVRRSIECDPSDGRIIGDAGAMRLWKRYYEPGWEPVV